MATGGLRFWKDGRDVYDVLLALFDYPEGFNLSLRVNFVDGGEESEGFLFTGSEGIMEIAGNPLASCSGGIYCRCPWHIAKAVLAAPPAIWFELLIVSSVAALGGSCRAA